MDNIILCTIITDRVLIDIYIRTLFYVSDILLLILIHTFI